MQQQAYRLYIKDTERKDKQIETVQRHFGNADAMTFCSGMCDTACCTNVMAKVSRKTRSCRQRQGQD